MYNLILFNFPREFFNFLCKILLLVDIKLKQKNLRSKSGALFI